MKTEIRLLILGVASLLLTGLVPVQAQERPPTPGSVREPFKEPILAPAPDPGAAVELPQPLKPFVPEGGKKIHIREFTISGNQLFTTEQLLAAVSEYVDQDLTLHEIYGVADVLTRYYRDRGYTLANVAVPAQKVSSGTVRFEVIEGRIGDTSVENSELYGEEFLLSRLKGIEPSGILTTEALERQLMILNDLPGVSARAVIKPGARYGTADVLIRTEEEPFSGVISLNNYGKYSIGNWRLEGDFNFNNPFGIGDAFNLFLVKAEDGLLYNGRVEYSFPLNDIGTRLSASYSRFVYTVATGKLDLDGTDLDGDGTDMRLQISHPLLRSPSRNLLLAGGITRTESKQGGDLVLDRGRRSFINVLDLSLALSEQHRDGSVTDFSATLSSNGKRNEYGLDEHAHRGQLELNGTHLRSIGPHWYLVANANVVWSIDPVVDVRKFRLGGPGSVRGFVSSELSGDEGVFASLEARLPFQPLPDNSQIQSTFKAFWDAGRVNRIRPPPGLEGNESLTSVGIGLTTRVDEDFVVDLEIAKPFNSRRVHDIKGSTQMWASFSASF